MADKGKKAKNPFLSTLDMNTYRPDAKALHQVLWGQDHEPTPAEQRERLEKMRRDLEKLRAADGSKKEAP